MRYTRPMSGRFDPVLTRLRRLAEAPPGSLLLEGGSEADREGMATRWAMLLNCEGAPEERPCGVCAACRRIEEGASRDVLRFDWRGGPWKGSVEELREARRIMGEPPRDGRARVIILFEAHGMRAEQANTLLKSIEEPRAGNHFVLTSPQRERVLPTLVSRSMVLTLPWPEPGGEALSTPEGEEGEDPEGWARAVYGFASSGRGLFPLTGKGKMERGLVERVTVVLSRDLAQALSGRAEGDGARLLAGMDPAALRSLDLTLDQAKQALDAMARPALVLEWLAVELRGLAARSER
ncbi:hypothetical protein, partial [Desulfohalovibrio reitneri]|uniref:hypothetical protein n=1 Tax=Desulfohalovibrio reitneri TaxID=1307759 RepID=UPI0004A76464